MHFCNNYIQFKKFFLKPVKTTRSQVRSVYIYIYISFGQMSFKKSLFLTAFRWSALSTAEKAADENRTLNASMKAAKAGSINWVAASKRDPIKKYINIDEIKRTMALKHDPARNRTHREGT